MGQEQQVQDTTEVPEQRIYPHAPIRQAIINVLVDELDAVPDTWQKLHEVLGAGWGPPTPVRSQEVTVQLGSRMRTETSQAVIGVEYKHAELPESFLLTTHGFTYFRKNPYSHWQDLMKRASSSFEHFWTSIPEPKAVRLGLRYINKIQCKPETPLNEVFNMHPVLPAGISPHVKNIIMRMEFPTENADELCLVLITSAQTDNPAYSPMILDIDVVRKDNLPTSLDGVIHAFDQMRVTKNAFFEKILTDSIKETFS